jgi:hypothetical protein
MNQLSYGNQSAFQQNSAPSFACGYFSDNYGTHRITYGQDLLTVNQDLSNLNTSISTADAYTDSLQKAKHYAQTQVDSSQKLYTETRGIAERNVADLVQHIASSDAFSSGHNTSEIKAFQESANWIKNSAASWGHQYGLSERESMEYFASLGLEGSWGISLKGGQSGICGALSDEARQKAENILNSQDFQEHYQRVSNATHHEAINSMTDEGRRYVENYAASMENLKSAQQQFSTSYSKLNQISENLSHVQSHTSSVNTNLNTEFSNWLSDRNALGAIFNSERKEELNSLRDTFIAEKCHAQIGSLENYQDPKYTPENLPQLEEKKWEELKSGVQQKSGLSFGLAKSQGQKVIDQYESLNGKVSEAISNQKQEVYQTHSSMQQDFTTQYDRALITRATSRLQNHAINLKDYALHVFNEFANPKP